MRKTVWLAVLFLGTEAGALDCSKIEDDEKRLQCYDLAQEVGQAGESENASSLAIWKQSLLETFKDPGSAEFRNEKSFTDLDGGTYYCGEVNARNSFGGYVGFSRYVADGRAYIIDRETSSGLFDRVWRSSCEGSSARSIVEDWVIYGTGRDKIAATTSGNNYLFMNCSSRGSPILTVEAGLDPQREGWRHPFGLGGKTTIVTIGGKDTRWEIGAGGKFVQIVMHGRRMKMLAWMAKLYLMNFKFEGYESVQFSTDGFKEAGEIIRKDCESKYWEKYWDPLFE